jgi:hypothetical protein
MEPTKTEKSPSFRKQYKINPENDWLVQISLNLKLIEKSRNTNLTWRMEM